MNLASAAKQVAGRRGHSRRQEGRFGGRAFSVGVVGVCNAFNVNDLLGALTQGTPRGAASPGLIALTASR
jgi:hypothetical protein